MFNAKKNSLLHLYIFFIGLSWLILAPYKKIESNPNKCDNVVYEDTNIPRKDDLIFNSIGQLLYFLIY